MRGRSDDREKDGPDGSFLLRGVVEQRDDARQIPNDLVLMSRDKGASVDADDSGRRGIPHLVTIGHDESVNFRVQVSLNRDVLDELDHVCRQFLLVGEDLDCLEEQGVAARGEVAKNVEDAFVLDSEGSDKRRDELVHRFSREGCHLSVFGKQAVSGQVLSASLRFAATCRRETRKTETYGFSN